MGNHDYRRTADGFTSAISSLAAKDYPNVRVVLNPEVVNLTKIKDDNLTGTSLILLPYRDRRMYPGTTTEEDSKFYEAELESLIKSCPKENAKIAIGHNFYYFGSYTDYAGTEILVKPDAFYDCDMVAMGHYHEFKILRKKLPITIYTGSMEKLNFGDEKVDKYFLDYETESKKTKIIKIKSREMQDLVLDLTECTPDNLMQTCVDMIKALDLKDKIIRCKALIKDTVVPFIKRNSIEQALYSHDSFYVSRVVIEPVFQRIIRDDSILEHKDDFSIFSAFLNDQGFDPELKNKILDEAKKIIEAI